MEKPDETKADVAPGLLARVRRLSVDISPLKNSPDYRRLWSASLVSYLGSFLTAVAIPYQVYELTGSTAAVGLIGLVELFPLLFLSLVGGAIADAVDRRKLLLITESLTAVSSLGLAYNASLSDPHVWLLFVLAGANAAMYALGTPAFRSLTPLFVKTDDLSAAAALAGMSRTLSAVAGPALAGVLLATVGLTRTYLFDAVSFFAILVAVFRMRPVPVSSNEERFTFKSILDGVRFLRGRPVLQGSFIVDIIAMVFGMATALFPAVAAELGGPQVLGLLYSAPYAGALVASLTSGWTGRARRHGLIVYLAVAGWAVSLIVFGMSNTLWLTLLALAGAGASDMVSAIFRSTILQTAAPPTMIGRLSGLELAVVTSGPSVGDIEAGLLAAATSVRFAIVAGGVACLAGVAVMAVFLPQFARYDSHNPTP